MLEALLETAWNRREESRSQTKALRIFHGPTEAPTHPAGRRIAIEWFASPTSSLGYAWIFTWEQDGQAALEPETLESVTRFLLGKGCVGAVWLERPERGTPEDARLLFGEVPEFLDTTEGTGEKTLWFRIRFLGTKHPGLFLDHAPLRQWLVSDLASIAPHHAGGPRVLNTFAYTGSLSVAARRGGASRVVTLDLSRPTIGWARENWSANFGEDTAGDFIYGDVFEWLPRLEKRGDRFEVVVLDPPSFSRSPKKIFSTSKDLPALHASALRLLTPGGLLISSINSAQVPSSQFRRDIEAAAKSEGRNLREIRALGAPSATFPGVDSMKGWIFQA